MSEPTTIAADREVTFHYLLTDANGGEIDSSVGREPLTYVHGRNMLFPAVEQALLGMQAGEVVRVTLQPDEAYGPRDPNLVVRFPRDRFDFDLEVGGVVQAQREGGTSQPLQVIELSDDEVTLDGNHPLAGKTLVFAISIQSIRHASP